MPHRFATVECEPCERGEAVTAQTDGLPDIETWYDTDRAVVEVVGELDAYTRPRLRRALEELAAPAATGWSWT